MLKKKGALLAPDRNQVATIAVGTAADDDLFCCYGNSTAAWQGVWTTQKQAALCSMKVLWLLPNDLLVCIAEAFVLWDELRELRNQPVEK